jgi:hypothetical protein
MTHRIIAPALALAALATAHTAQAQQQACVAPADLSDAVVYAMPIAYDAARTSCANRLSPNGFIARRGEGYIAPYRAGQTKAWPGAFRFLKTFMEQDAAAGEAAGMDMKAMLSAMPEDALRPFVDALVGQMIAEQIKGESCDKIERGLELLSPLPSDNVGGLIAFVVELADLKNPPVCAAPAAARAPR